MFIEHRVRLLRSFARDTEKSECLAFSQVVGIGTPPPPHPQARVPPLWHGIKNTAGGGALIQVLKFGIKANTAESSNIFILDLRSWLDPCS